MTVLSFLRRGLMVLGAATLAVGLLSSSGCNPPSTFGEEFIPGREVQVFGGLGVEFIPVTDSVITGSGFGNFTNFLLGNYVDPHLGRINAALITQFQRSVYLPNGADTTFGYDITVDSCILTLSLTARYGRTSDPQRLRVYNLNQELKYDTDGLFTNFDTASVDQSVDLAGGATLAFNENSTNTRARFPIDNSVGQRLLALGLQGTNLSNDTNFNRFFRGLYIGTDPVTAMPGQFRGAMYTAAIQTFSPVALFPFGSDSVNIHVFFRSRAASNGDTLNPRRAVFTAAAIRSVSFSSVRRSQTAGTLLDTVINRISPNAGRNLIIAGGVDYKLRFKLGSLRDSLPRGIVNSALLTLYTDPAYSGGASDSLRFPPPAILTFGGARAAPDTLSEDFAFVSPFPQQNVRYNTNQRSYTIPMGQAIGQLLNGAPDNGFILYAFDRSTRAARLVLAGPKHPNPALRPRLTVYYTPFNR